MVVISLWTAGSCWKARTHAAGRREWWWCVWGVKITHIKRQETHSEVLSLSQGEIQPELERSRLFLGKQTPLHGNDKTLRSMVSGDFSAPLWLHSDCSWNVVLEWSYFFTHLLCLRLLLSAPVCYTPAPLIALCALALHRRLSLSFASSGITDS